MLHLTSSDAPKGAVSCSLYRHYILSIILCQEKHAKYCMFLILQSAIFCIFSLTFLSVTIMIKMYRFIISTRLI